jgi:hypothetical protein
MLSDSYLLILKGGTIDINIVQILHLLNFFELKRTLVYINLQLRTRKVLDIQLVCHDVTNIAVQNVNKGFVYITDLTWTLKVCGFQHNHNHTTKRTFPHYVEHCEKHTWTFLLRIISMNTGNSVRTHFYLS